MSNTGSVTVTPPVPPGAGPGPGAGPADAPLALLRGFHPGWFGAVMGTAIVGVAAYLNPGNISGLASASRHTGQVMAILAAVLAVILAVPYVARWLRNRDAALADLRDPVVGALYGTFPGGILVLAAAAASIGPSLMPADAARTLTAALAWAGVPLAFAISVIFAYLLFARPEIGHEAVNGGWFIPPVVNIVVPMVLVPLIPGASPTTARLLLMACYAFWGTGFLLFLLVATTLHHRMVASPLPGAGLAPSLWIGLGPVGVGAITLVKMGGAATVLGPEAGAVAAVSRLAATALWGFGVWWLAAAIVLLAGYLRRGPLPYGLGWWAFTFPLGAFTVATLTLARAWHLGLLEWSGAVLFVLLAAFWLVVTAWTLRAVRTGEAWRPAAPAR